MFVGAYGNTPILLKKGVLPYAPTRILQKMTLTKYNQSKVPRSTTFATLK